MARRRVQSPVHKTVPLKKSKGIEPDSDAEDDWTGSQQMLALATILKKPKNDDKGVEQFRARITADRQRLKAQLDQRMREAEESETRRRNEIASTISIALKTPNRPVQGHASTFAGTKIAENAAYLPVADVLTSAEALLEEYERLDKMISDVRDEQTYPMAETWHQDLEGTKQKLEMGARVALRNVKKVLGAEVNDDAVAAGGEGDEEMTLVEDDSLNYELQKSLRYVERGVKRMVKGLPADED